MKASVDNYSRWISVNRGQVLLSHDVGNVGEENEGDEEEEEEEEEEEVEEDCDE